MPRNQSAVNVSAVISPAMSEEIDRIARAEKISRSAMVRKLLEERLTQRADQRLTEAYDKVEQRLRRIESRFSAFMAKNVRLTAQALWLEWYHLKEFTEITKEEMKTLNEEARNFAGQQLKQMKDELSSDDVV
jgi:hypothetical protein